MVENNIKQYQNNLIETIKNIKIEDKISKKGDYFKIQKPINPSHVVMSNVFKYSDIQEFNKKKYTKTNNSLIRSYS